MTTAQVAVEGRPSGVTTIAVVFLLLGLYLVALAVLIASGSASLMSGAYVLEGLQLMGVVAYVSVAILALASAAGLLYCKSWARRLGCLLIAALFVGAIPAVSAAVVDFRFWSLIRDGSKVIACAAAWFYLSQPQTRAAFRK
jgi:hypothetical protein